MDSDDSNAGSSVSNSSSSSSENSRSSPEPINEITNAPNVETIAEERELSRTNSRGSNHTSSKSEFNSSSSSSSSDNENDEIKSPLENVSNRRSNSGSPQQPKSLRSSRHSSVSSSSSRSNSPNSIFRNSVPNISHEELSDVSDMESEKRESVLNSSKPSVEDDATNVSSASINLDQDRKETNSELLYSLEAENSQNAVITDLRQKLDLIKTHGKTTETSKAFDGTTNLADNERQTDPIEELVKPNDEDALDFEAEEGECQDISKDDEKIIDEAKSKPTNDKEKTSKSDGEAEDGEELEEGEVSDEDEKRPEETEPKPVCRFYTRGQCTWGMSCRFLHPGVTDKGNYTMFDLVRPVPVTQTGPSASRPSNYPAHTIDYHDFRTDRPALHQRLGIQHPPSAYGAHHDPRAATADTPVVIESAWERGLRTAKEMMRKANKRKEQDMDFEDKKMNLTLSPDELEKDAYYLKERGSPQDIATPYGRHNLYQEPLGMYSPTERFARGPPITAAYDDVDSYGRSTRYRELPPHRMPQYEDERRVRPTREVIVQRVEPVGRGDEWRDPWMRSPGVRGESRDHSSKRRHDRRSYSSNSSYSSSSSSRSDSSSESSRSSSPAGHRRRYNSSHKTSPTRRHGIRSARSPSLPRRPRHSPSLRHSPNAKRKGTLSPTVEKRSAYSPVHKRKKTAAQTKKSDKLKSRHRVTSSSSGSDSSDSSDSDSDSGSSSSDSSSMSRGRPRTKRSRTTDKLVHERRSVKKAEPTKKRSPISIEIKKQPTVGVSALASSPTHSINSEKDLKKSRREELLKQLRAVEDAIAKKRSKLN
ncbi:zinc finger CCCH domain-containing protein 18 isoform X1 [Zeugodacus cucurbitae]|uniref:Zinc finger CCCH domain-containing protein 18 n=1 Tax=Zeugodacus cucurbitae TaxID=28588 RepID=A0A0A1WWU4_ZEUCU|nr:zinc finger CCCH domain-containing protein 18 isoform X1 [Zeugodacus cucurbitae]XP_011193182.1 zinc finger CCCH domain-containing protein 18 isoform X1 [Zeugodacus cucurbitae]XP_054088160.1 zinc finger CCCH domain-containing protein 18 isoform X1 [Zeugodacus cucurbitae]